MVYFKRAEFWHRTGLRPVVGRLADLSGIRALARQLSWVRRCACRTPGLAGEQLALHLAFCDACGQAVPDKAVAEMERLRLLVEGVNNKIRVLQRRAYGYRAEEYLKLKIVAAFLPPLPRNAVFNPHESA